RARRGRRSASGSGRAPPATSRRRAARGAPASPPRGSTPRESVPAAGRRYTPSACLVGPYRPTRDWHTIDTIAAHTRHTFAGRVELGWRVETPLSPPRVGCAAGDER